MTKQENFSRTQTFANHAFCNFSRNKLAKTPKIRKNWRKCVHAKINLPKKVLRKKERRRFKGERRSDMTGIRFMKERRRAFSKGWS